MDPTADASELLWARNIELYPSPLTYAYQMGTALAGLALSQLGSRPAGDVENFVC